MSVKIIDKRGNTRHVSDLIGNNRQLLKKQGYRRIDNIDYSVFVPLKPDNYIATIYLVGSRINWNNFPFTPDISAIEKWAQSLLSTGLTGIVFHNCFSAGCIARFAKYPVHFSFVEMPAGHNSGLYRFEIYEAFLKKHGPHIKNIFFTDSTDLEVLRNPFTSNKYNANNIYIGCEPDTMSSVWMWKFSDTYPAYRQLVSADPAFATHPLLNAGLCGGSYQAIAPFITRMAHQCAGMRNVAGFQDMPIINYLAYTEFKQQVVFGPQVNTVFKSYCDNGVAWFKHK